MLLRNRTRRITRVSALPLSAPLCARPVASSFEQCVAQTFCGTAALQEPSAASAASAAKKPVPKFKRRKAAESAPGGSDGAVSRKPRFVGTARTLGSSGDEADASATGADTPSADARGAGAQVGAKPLGAKGAGAKKAAVARTLAPRADAKASSSAEPEDESAVARPSLLQQLLAMLVRILAWLGSTLLALFAPKEVRHDVRS
eukprot:3360574-Pleurochrysis_carterae.AAC.1